MPLVMCLSLCEYKWGSAKTIFSCWTWLFSLLSLFCNFYSFCICISEENESDIRNKIARINESERWKMIGSYPITFAEHHASHHKLRIWKMRKISCWFQDYGLLFLSPRMPQVLGRSSAPSSGPRSPNRPIAYCYEESVLWKYIKNIILSLLFSLYQRREWKWYME